MSYVYTEADYHGTVDTNYRRYPWFDDRGRWVHGKLNSYLNSPVVVAGCGWGYLVEELLSLGFTDPWGFDASAYAISQAQAVLTAAAADRIVQADATVRADMDNLRSVAGLKGNKSFDACITEDLLPCASSATEVDAMLTELRYVAKNLAHIVTPRLDNVPQDPQFLWLYPDEWRALIGPDEPIILVGTHVEVP